MRSIQLSLFFLALALAARAAESLHVAAAADLEFALPRLNEEFQKANPQAEVVVSFGSSGNFFAQIKNGAPFEVFLSADSKYASELAKQGLADGASLTKYAIGKIVLWTLRSDLEVSSGLSRLTDEKIKRVAIANPDHAPYGRAARSALQKANLWDVLQAKIVLGENIAQTAQYVQGGNAEAGIVALSLVRAPKLKGVGKYYEIPTADYPPIEQAAIITKIGSGNPLARKYLEFLRSEPARKIFAEFGFSEPNDR